MSGKIFDNEFAFFFFFQQWFTQIVRVLVGFFLFLRPIDGQRLDGCVSFVIEQDSLLWQIWSKKLSGKPDSIPSRRGCNIVAGQQFFHSAIHNYNCPQLSLIFMQLMLRYNYLYTRRVFFRAGATNWTLLKWRPWLLSWRLSLFPYVTVSQLESIPWMARSRLGCFLFNSSLYHIMKNQVLRKAKKFTILISYFHELWKLKSLPPVSLITAGERNSFKICTQFLKQMVSQTRTLCNHGHLSHFAKRWEIRVLIKRT